MRSKDLRADGVDRRFGIELFQSAHPNAISIKNSASANIIAQLPIRVPILLVLFFHEVRKIINKIASSMKIRVLARCAFDICAIPDTKRKAVPTMFILSKSGLPIKAEIVPMAMSGMAITVGSPGKWFKRRRAA